MSTKLDDLDYAIFEMAYKTLRDAEEIAARHHATVIKFLDRAATQNGIDPNLYYFNIGTRSFELKPENPATQAMREERDT